jgi:hypothetical protein
MREWYFQVMGQELGPLSVAEFWFRSSTKPSLTTIRGQLKLGEGDELALSETFTIIMHGDSP